jgi:hypothetical protein
MCRRANIDDRLILLWALRLPRIRISLHVAAGRGLGGWSKKASPDGDRTNSRD